MTLRTKCFSLVTRRIGSRFAAALVLAGTCVGGSAGGVEVAAVAASPAAAFGNLPVSFEANLGQADGDASFIARGPAYYFSISPTGARVSLRKLDQKPSNVSAGQRSRPNRTEVTFQSIRLEFLGANPHATVSGEDELAGRVNYFLGNDPARWRAGVPTYARVRVVDVYPGINLLHYGNQQHLEYDFEVAPGADPSAIAIRYSGADQIATNSQGDLILTLGVDEIRQPKPLIYQTVRGARREIAGGYLLSEQTVKFEVGDYDHSLPLVIDPVLSYSTYYGGSGVDAAWGVVVDANGFVYIAGETMGGLPVTSGTLTNLYGGGTAFHGDAFVAKFDNRALQVIYRTYVGGALDDVGLALAVDNGGNAYITGYTDSTDFPTKSAIFNTISGVPYPPPVNIYPVDGFVTKLGPLGTNLIYSTYLGGGWVDVGWGIAVDPAGNAYVAGYTGSTNFPTANVSGAFTNYGGNGDAFVTKFGPAGTNLVYSMYLGGTNLDQANDVAADAIGLAYVTGLTGSRNFPVTPNAAQPWLAGTENAFVTVVGVNGANLVSSTYLGGIGTNAGYRIVLDSAANIYVTGATANDPGFPVTPGGLNPGGVFRSGNGGSNWNISSIGLQSVTIYDLAINPLNPTWIYAGTSRGIARSTDGGATWNTAINVAPASQLSGLGPSIAVGSVLSVAVESLSPLNIYAGTAQGVFKSFDAGLNWSLSSTGLNVASTVELAIDPVTPSIIYAGGNAGVYTSTNAATNWSAINAGLGNFSVRALAIPPTTPATIYAATAGGVYRSTNRGAGWTVFNNGLGNLSVQAIAIDPFTPATVYVGTAGGVFKSVNAATNWSAVYAGLTISNITALAIDSLTPMTIYAGTTNGLFKSSNAGTNWNASTNGLSAPPILTVLLNPQSPGTLYTGTLGTNLYGGQDVFLTKLGPNGYAVVWGGSLNDQGWDVAVDSSGHAHVIGTTLSTDFPTRNTFGFLSASNAGLFDVFLSEFSGDGQTLINSAYFGGASVDSGYGIAVDAAGDVYLAGQTASANFPTRAALQGIYAGSQDAFLAKVSTINIPLVLDIRSVSNAVQLSWTALASEFQLQSQTNLAVTNGWVNVPGVPVQTNLMLTVTLPATNAAQFFRLADP